ncbi:MAG: hypothetical protein K6G57_01800 [Lachnospiraceae bacterium]|nr:hypothetical protein [Lachnospiraceae bacterium]
MQSTAGAACGIIRPMKTLSKKITTTLISALLIISLTSCAGLKKQDSAEIKEFREKIETFCNDVNRIDKEINSIDTTAEGYEEKIVTLLDSLNGDFKDFSEMDFPSEYKYLEPLADEAADYMTKAVDSYREAFTAENLTEDSIRSQYDYATANYERAYKRIKAIMTLLSGKETEDVNIESN